MKKFLVVLAFCLGGCASTHAVLRTEIIINGKPHAGEIYCTDMLEKSCQDAMGEFCKGLVTPVKQTKDVVCYMRPTVMTIDRKDSEKRWERVCDEVYSINFVCVD